MSVFLAFLESGSGWICFSEYLVIPASLFLILLIKLSNIILSIRFTPKFASNTPEFFKNKIIVRGKTGTKELDTESMKK